MSGCAWAPAGTLLGRYHDTEWGRPLHDDQKQFEFLMLEALQCGLNWNLMLQKREIFHQCFADFDYDKVAAFTESDVERILATPGMLRSRRKIEAVIHNAKCFQAVRNEHGSFSAWLWRFTDGRTLLYEGHEAGRVPARNALSDTVAAALRQYGFRFLGSVTVYAHLQACGVINDHGANCPCYRQINDAFSTLRLPPQGEG